MAISKTKLFVGNPDNEVLDDLVAELLQGGTSQADVARLLSISPSQLSRLRSGERQATPGHVRALKQLLRERKPRKRRRLPAPFYAINSATLGELSPHEAVSLFRDLLWSEATRIGVSTARVNVSLNVNAADGGIDASILGNDSVGTLDGLLCGASRYQIKTGAAAPWQRKWVEAEVLNKKRQLSSAVLRCLRDGGRYVLVCYGVDFLDEQLRKSEDLISHVFAEHGYQDIAVRVWGQGQLVRFLKTFPSLCLSLQELQVTGFRSHASWGRQDDMRGTAHFGPEQQELIEEIRGHLHAGDIAHIRLLGEPGVGKTRIALEATGTSEIAPTVIYSPDGASFLQSTFFAKLIRTDDSRFVVLVVDECRAKDRAEIWNLLKARADKTRLITIDHGPDEFGGETTKVLHVPASNVAQIEAIIADYGIDKHEATRWAEFCQGCPRVAHVIGRNLQSAGVDLLRSTETINIWDRFIVGGDDPASEEVELRKVVLRHISLFERFGFEPPVQAEAEFIASLAQACDPRITWPRFQALVETLKRRRILQGARTLYITPRLLHVYLYRDFWQNHGRFDLLRFLQALPQSLWHWFVEMLKFAHESEVAKRSIEQMLAPNGAFEDDRYQDSSAVGRLFMALADSHPSATLQCLQRLLSKMTPGELKGISQSRQSLVWALERIAVWGNHFSQASNLLLLLAEHENCNNSNNATGTFCSLFSLIPGMAGTQAAPALRMSTLSKALDSTRWEVRQIALKACKSALATRGGYRMVGAEHQGVRRTIQFWEPKTYGELWESYAAVWRLLVDKLSDWTGQQRESLIDAIIASAWGAFDVPSLVQDAMATLETLADDPCANIKSLVEFIDCETRFRAEAVNCDVVERLNTLRTRLDGSTFHARLRRFVRFVTFQDTYDGTKETTTVPDRLRELALEALEDSTKLVPELEWLTREHSSPAANFGFLLGERDVGRTLLPSILQAHKDAGSEAKTSFLSGYLNAIFVRDKCEWESELRKIAELSGCQSHFADLVVGSGMSNAMALAVVEKCRAGTVDRKCLINWWFSGWIRLLDADVVTELIRMQIEDPDRRFWGNAVQMCHTYLREADSNRELPSDFLFDLLTHEGISDDGASHTVDFYWSRLASTWLKQCGERRWEFFRKTLINSTKDWHILSDLDMNNECVLTQILRSDPAKAWSVIGDVWTEMDGRERFGVSHWLSSGGRGFDDTPGPIQYVPFDVLASWIDEDFDERCHWVGELLPKTLDPTGPGALTRNYLAKYYHKKNASSAVLCNLHSGGWVGNASDHYRSKRQEAQTWLKNESDPNVRQWIEDYVVGLNQDIERAEIEEERGR